MEANLGTYKDDIARLGLYREAGNPASRLVTSDFPQQQLHRRALDLAHNLASNAQPHEDF
jgi:hypothetical protein